MKKSLSRPEKSPVGLAASPHAGAILEAAYSFLETQPISAISLLHIARKAGVKHCHCLPMVVDQGSATPRRLPCTKWQRTRDRCKRCAARTAEAPRNQAWSLLYGRHGAVVARLLTAIQDDPELKEAFFERVVQSPQSKELRVAVKDAMRAGDLPQRPTSAISWTWSSVRLSQRLIVQNEPIRESFVISVFDHVVNSTKSLGR